MPDMKMFFIALVKSKFLDYRKLNFLDIFRYKLLPKTCKTIFLTKFGSEKAIFLVLSCVEYWNI